MKTLGIAAALVLCLAELVSAQAQVVRTQKDDLGWKIQVDGVDFAIKGVVWDDSPIGENYTYDLYKTPDDHIMKVLDTDMPLLKAMGVNAIRSFTMIPPRWIEYIYDRYGIRTMVNDLFGRYGVTVDGRWQFPTDYSDPRTRATLLAQAKRTFETYKDTRGVLLYMLGNESNYGLDWTSAAVENLPAGEGSAYKAKALYSLFEEAFKIGKAIDTNHPMGLINGDLSYLKVIRDEVPDLDILGVNTYRGPLSYAAFYNSIAKELGKPFVYTEFGADAYNVKTDQEDQDSQAKLIRSQWREVYEQAYGKGKAANCLGGYVFQWVDGWSKSDMDNSEGMSIHDTSASWSNGGYTFDSVPGKNNMNEEWFGIAGLSRIKDDGVERRLPRTAYYLLKEIWTLDMYTSTRETVAKKFDSLNFESASEQGNLSQLRDQTTYPLPLFVPHGSVTTRTWFKGEDLSWQDKGKTSLVPVTQTTLLAGFDLRGPEGLTGSFTVRILPKSAVLDPTYDHVDPVEVAGKTSTTANADGTHDYAANVELYKATIKFQSPDVKATVHYHDGHSDWVTEGDFFGLLPEAFDLFSPDKEGSKAPFGVEVELPSLAPGLKVYGGPEIFWGAQPRVMAKYSRQFGIWGLHALYDQEFGVKADASGNPLAAKNADSWAALAGDVTLPRLGKLELGALLGQYNRVGSVDHTYSKVVSGSVLANNKFTWADALAAKLLVSSDFLPYLKLTAQYLYAGPLAETRASLPREGSQIFDVGTGNRSEFLGIVQATYGDFVLRSSVLARTPLLAPLNDPSTGATIRNPLDDEFFVWQNRETLAGEAVLTWDQTGATYFHDWNNNDREESPLSASLGLLYNFHQGATDAYQFHMANGTLAKFTTGLPAVDGMWSLQGRIAGRPLPGTKLVVTATAGRLQSTGQDTRVVQFSSFKGQASWDRVVLEGGYAKDAWGPFNWDREFNVTYPIQWTAGLAYSLKPVSLMSDSDRIGLRFSYWTLDQYAVAAERTDGTYTNVNARFTTELYAGWSF